MNTFVKVLLLVVAAIVAVKLLPLTFALGCVLGLLLVGLLLLGLSMVAVALVASVALVSVLAPIWIPVLLIVGLFALIKRLSAKPVAA